MAKQVAAASGGWSNILAATSTDRPEKKTEGPGNDLPEGKRYAVQTPNPQYNAIGVFGLPFQNGRSETSDREIAWKLKSDFGYTVEPIEG